MTVGTAGTDTSGTDEWNMDSQVSLAAAGGTIKSMLLYAGTDLSGADLRECDLFQAVLDGAKLDRADLSGAEVSGLNLLRLASFSRLRITADQQYALLSALGVDVDP